MLAPTFLKFLMGKVRISSTSWVCVFPLTFPPLTKCVNSSLALIFTEDALGTAQCLLVFIDLYDKRRKLFLRLGGSRSHLSLRDLKKNFL